MNQVLASGLALIIFTILWSFGRRPKNQLSNGISLSREAPISSVFATSAQKKSKYSKKSVPLGQGINGEYKIPKTSYELINFRKKLRYLIAQGPSERLEAVKMSSYVSDGSIIPILVRGLKDSDILVVEEAAKAIQKFKCNAPILNSQAISRPPRNIALTL